MNIVIEIQDKKIGLILKKNKGKVVNKFYWQENQNLSQQLLIEIDNLLQKNNLNLADIKNVNVETNISDKFTTVRIAKTIAKTFNSLRD